MSLPDNNGSRPLYAQVRERLATWDVALPVVDHPELGRA